MFFSFLNAFFFTEHAFLSHKTLFIATLHLLAANSAFTAFQLIWLFAHENLS